MSKESFEVIKFKYDNHAYSLDEILKLTTERIISEDQFHFITGYDYEWIKKERG